MKNRLKAFLKNNILFIGALFSLGWLLMRTGTRPDRIRYPCQQAAAANVVTLFNLSAFPFMFGFGKATIEAFRKNYLKFFVMIFCMGLLFVGVQEYNSFQKNQVISKLSKQSIVPMSLVAYSAAASGYVAPIDPMRVSTDQALVSYAYEENVDYGNEVPFDPEDNPAYDLVWRAVEQLGFGDAQSPLKDFVGEDDYVLIKPNIGEPIYAAYTDPAVVRPIIDMLVEAGVKTIRVGDGSIGYPYTEKNFDLTGYRALLESMQEKYPEVTIELVNLNNNEHWHWVQLDKYSCWAGSGYGEEEFGNFHDSQGYYSEVDPQGVSPDGSIAGWKPINDWVLNATAIINVPKLKTHNYINTISMKNLVGVSMAHPTDYDYVCCGRLVHELISESGENWSFNSDSHWRDILDLNKIVLYTDKDGKLHDEQQRKYLVVVDAIHGKQGKGYEDVGLCHRTGPEINTTYSIIASTNPVAADSVSSRIMGYNHEKVPLIKNAHRDRVHPVGTNDRSKIRIVGDSINEQQSTIYEHCHTWVEYSEKQELNITDFTPPELGEVLVKKTELGYDIKVDISDAHTAYVYHDDGFVQMVEVEDGYLASIPSATKIHIVAQDYWFNTVKSEEYTLS